MTYKASANEAVAQPQPIVAEKGGKLCCAYCGGEKWHRPELFGEVTERGFKQTTFEYRCVTCHNVVSEQQVKEYFAKL